MREPAKKPTPRARPPTQRMRAPARVGLARRVAFGARSSASTSSRPSCSSRSSTAARWVSSSSSRSSRRSRTASRSRREEGGAAATRGPRLLGRERRRGRRTSRLSSSAICRRSSRRVDTSSPAGIPETNVPRPCSLRTRSSRSSHAYTARTVFTFTPAASASSLRLGRRSPGTSRPSRPDLPRELRPQRELHLAVDCHVESRRA
jgi:hypothetical protein